MVELIVQGAVHKSQLPSSTSSDLVVVTATWEEYVQTSLLNAEEWQGPVSLADYLEREQYLRSLDLTNKDALTVWILTSTKLPAHPDGTRPILAACETLLKTAYVARNGEVEVVRAHGIASVFARKQYRGRGYAARMLKELGKQLESYQQKKGEKGSLSVLFSDIGPDYYANFGWEAFSSTHIELKPLDVKQYDRLKSSYPTVQDLTRADLRSLPASEYMEKRLETVSKQNKGVPCVAIRPDYAHFDWHIGRGEILTRLLGRDHPTVHGAIHEATGVAIVWSFWLPSNPQEWCIHILNVVIPPRSENQTTDEVQSALSALLLRVQYEAHTWDMVKGVEIWDPSELVISAAQSLRTQEQGAVTVIRRDKDHINCLRWMGKRTGDDEAKGVIWIGTEKYAWN